jgi:DNA-binding PadR family transcriptional regulator
MHGYQIMQTMRDRTGGAWRPSPGAVYPTIAQLEDEGLVTAREEGGRRLVTLTPEGTAYLEERSARLGDPFADFGEGTNGPDLRDPLHELQMAARQIAAGGDSAQLEAAAKVLGQARRSLYLILAGEPEQAAE